MKHWWAALSLCLAACASTPPVDADSAAVQRFATDVDTLRTTQRIPGLAVVVLHDQRVLLARGLGVADVATGVPVTPDTLFNIASVSKPISAVVALRLVERGQLDLDRPLATADGFTDFCAGARRAGGLFFGDFNSDTQPLTLRHLLSMTANGPAGSRFFYNPQAFSWASRPIAQAAGLPFSDLVVREIFVPAGMHDAARIHRNRPLPPALQVRLAAPHRIDADGRAVRASDPPPQGDGAAGGVIASAMDLARFDTALDSGRLLTEASKRQLWAATADKPYGLGWFVRELHGEPVVWHTGLWDDAYSALYLKLPGRGLTLILLANSDGLRWRQRLDEAAIERSPFALAFLQAFGVPVP